MTPQEARNIQNLNNLSIVGRALLKGLGAGVAVRATGGLIGETKRLLDKKYKKEKPEVDELFIPSTQPKLAAELNRGWWVNPTVVAGVPLSFAGGYLSVSKILKERRKKLDELELAKVKKDFDKAMRAELTSKFAKQLDELADAYVSGKLNGKLTKKAENPISSSVNLLRDSAATLMLLSALAGAGTGWAVYGKTKNQKDVSNYTKARNQLMLAAPKPMIALPSELESKTAAWSKGTVKGLHGLGKAIGTSGLGFLAGSHLMTGTPMGRAYVGSRFQELMSNPQFVQAQINQLMSNPQVQYALQNKVMPSMLSAFKQQHPIIGSML